jgi:hypothetical protein
MRWKHPQRDWNNFFAYFSYIVKTKVEYLALFLVKQNLKKITCKGLLLNYIE